MKKKSLFCVFCTATILGGLILACIMCFGIVQASNDGGIPKPSVPEFTVDVDGRRVSLTINNQPFVSYYDDNGWNIVFYYNVRLNGKELYRYSDGYPVQSGSQNTTISYNIREKADSNLGVYLWRIDTNTLKFQVEAMIGFTHRVVDGAMAPWVFTGETSGWNDTRTVTIEASDPTTPDEPTTSGDKTTNDESYQMEQLAVILGIVATVTAVAALGIGLLVYFKIRKQ